MEAAAHLAMIGAIGACIMGVLAALFSRTRKGTQSRILFFCLALLFAGIYCVTDALALRTKGLAHTMGRQSRVVRAADQPTEALISFGFRIFFGGGAAVVGLLGAVVFVLPERKNDAEENHRSEEDTSENTLEDAPER